MISKKTLDGPMNDTDFHCLADGVLSSIEADLEEADQEGSIDVEAMSGVLTLSLTDGKQYVISKHTPTRQVWVSSPFSGAHHFSYDAGSNLWKLESGKELRELLDGELTDVLNSRA